MKERILKSMFRKASYRENAEKRLRFWAWALEIKEDEIYNLPSPQNACGSVEAVDIAVKKAFGDRIKTPEVMARILGAKE